MSKESKSNQSKQSSQSENPKYPNIQISKYEGELGKAVGEVRIATSVVVVRSQQLCLLERLTFLGPGARAATERRALTQRLEERRRRDALAYQLSHINRGLARVGRAFIP